MTHLLDTNMARRPRLGHGFHLRERLVRLVFQPARVGNSTVAVTKESGIATLVRLKWEDGRLILLWYDRSMISQGRQPRPPG